MSVKRIHVISNSHLDREHRHSFQETRIMLVQMMDELIDIMENDPEYRYFTLDGQAIALEDYLEVKPAMRPRLAALIRSGRILIGPWYSLVDCYSVHPESVIRNLLVGHRVAGEFGEPMKIGYSIFSFGQIAQLPQIYAGFGIENIVFYKGCSRKHFPQSEFFWTAPDGSKSFANRLGREARWNFFFDFDIPVILGGDAKKPGWQSKFTDQTKLFHMNNEDYVRTFSKELDPDIRIREDQIVPCVRKVLSLLDESVAEQTFIAFDGTDFTSPLKEIPQAIRIANEKLDGEIELIHSNPAEYFTEVQKELITKHLIDYTGEMRFGPVSTIHSETMGTNPDIKQLLFHTENKIINYAEVLSSLLYIEKIPYEKEILDFAWKRLMAAQAHDSIHGSGDPKIKTDNINRLEQVSEIADSLIRRTAEDLGTLIDVTSLEPNENLIAVFNTTPYERDEIFTLTLDFPKEDLVQAYHLEEPDGTKIDYYELSKEEFNVGMVHRKYRPKSVYSDRRRVCADLKGIPPMGYKVVKLVWQKGEDSTSTNPFPNGVFPYKPIASAGNVLDNGVLRITVQPNGTLTVQDLRTGRTFDHLNQFTDIGSSGDFWVHRQPPYNSTISSLVGCAKVEITENSNLRARLTITVDMEIPEGLTPDRSRRSDLLISTRIRSTVTLCRASARIDFKTELDNRCRDHMLTVSFPTGIHAKQACWEAPLENRMREVDPFTNDAWKKGPELERHAMQHFVDVSGDNGGLALFTKGIREAGTTDDHTAVITLTLLRACSNTFPIHNDLLVRFENETSQCIGKHRFEYALCFHEAEADPVFIAREARKYTIPCLSAQVGTGKSGRYRGDRSFIQFTQNQLNLCAIKRAEDNTGMILRLNNPNNSEVTEEIVFCRKVQRADLTNLNEERIKSLHADGNRVKLVVGPYRIETICIHFEQE
jgi:mannosylglycerate hydrolase